MSEEQAQIHATVSQDLKHRLDLCAMAEGKPAAALIRESLEALLDDGRVGAAFHAVQYKLDLSSPQENSGKDE